MQSQRSARLIFAGVLLTASATSSAAAFAADTVGDFFRGKQIKIIIGTDAGGSYDLYARTVSRYLTKYLPGNPTFVPQNMPGGGGRTAANWLYNIGPKDGTAIGTFTQTAAVDQARKQEGIQFNVARFNWIGNPIVDNQFTMVSASTGLTSLEDVRTKGGMICGGIGASTPKVTFPYILNGLVGTRIRVISGYPGAGAVHLAIERGELNCDASVNWASARATITDLAKYNLLVQWGVERNPEISAYAKRDVPLIAEFAKTDLDRKVLNLINSGLALGKPLVAPPDVPKERIDALRTAFDKVMNEPEFLTEAGRLKLDINPLSGVKMQQVAMEVAQSSSDVLKRVDELMAPKDLEEVKKN